MFQLDIAARDCIAHDHQVRTRLQVPGVERLRHRNHEVPIGSLVLLDTNEFAVVLKPAADPTDAEHPYVKVITDVHGTPIENGREIDLHEKTDSGEYRHYIIRLIDNAAHKFDTSRYFV